MVVWNEARNWSGKSSLAGPNGELILSLDKAPGPKVDVRGRATAVSLTPVGQQLVSEFTSLKQSLVPAVLSEDQFFSVLFNGAPDLPLPETFEPRDFHKAVQRGSKPELFQAKNIRSWAICRGLQSVADRADEIIRLRNEIGNVGRSPRDGRNKRKHKGAADYLVKVQEGVQGIVLFSHGAGALNDFNQLIKELPRWIGSMSLSDLEEVVRPLLDVHWSDGGGVLRATTLAQVVNDALLPMPLEGLGPDGVRLLYSAAVNLAHTRGMAEASESFSRILPVLEQSASKRIQSAILDSVSGVTLVADASHYTMVGLRSEDAAARFVEAYSRLGSSEGGASFQCGGLRCEACFLLNMGKRSQALEVLGRLETQLSKNEGCLPKLEILTLRFYVSLLRAEAFWANGESGQGDRNLARKAAIAALYNLNLHSKEMERCRPSFLGSREYHISSVMRAVMYHLLAAVDPTNPSAPSWHAMSRDMFAKGNHASCVRQRANLGYDIDFLEHKYPHLKNNAY
ncbi:hypothetical protein [Azospirillum griseum]|uniref:Uncharacterized protein n=1 Tax=Azospirillum griseum TaxID=2496639 RepID=A0A3S0R563_9PROT|nr:hypothetical protein [Azospirillum griseum]RTR12779.1 hypothetical protein EJ903_25210 [Azospirillum griseum]